MFLWFLGHQYPKTATAEDLLEIAFIQGIIPAVTQDQVTKPKPSKEGEKKKDWNNINDDDDDDDWHTSVYDFWFLIFWIDKSYPKYIYLFI